MITIDKAIKNLTAGREDCGMIPEDEYTPTIDLAAEALKFFKDWRNEGAKAQLKKTLISIGKEARRMDNTTYLVPDYSKYRQAVKEAGIEQLGETEE